jgi:nicotinate phosphoribosyltransferase
MIGSNLGLYTDLYELTMAQGYYLTGRHNTSVCFDYFFRSNPFGGGYVVFAGLQDLLDSIKNYRFDHSACEYLESIGFDKKFTSYLADFSFQGEILAPREGEVVFPYEPVMIVKGNILEAQLIETILLNIINFQSLIATKASRMRLMAGERLLVDFGLRRAQGCGGIQASRAAMIGGCDSTSNVYAAQLYDLPCSGTQAHSWIQSFDDELTAFRQFAEIYPYNCILLVDTYDTLRSGVPNAIRVAKEMESKGKRLKGIRLDSGDLAYLSKKARKMLNDAGLNYVMVFASNQLDEYLIRSLDQQNAPIDGFGVGTRLITGKDDAALDGVFKLSSSDGKPRLKLSENLEKIIFPGEKKVYRFFNGDDMFYADAVSLSKEKKVDIIHHPHEQEKSCSLKGLRAEQLLQTVLKNGKQRNGKVPISEITNYMYKRLKELPEEHKRFENPHIYKVGLSKKLWNLRNKLIHTKVKE